MINLSMAEPDNMLRPRISVVGVGGAGGNAINNMIRSNLEGCDFIAANTDAQALAMSLASRKLQLGVTLSRGLGAGSKPEVGRAAAEEQLQDILNLLEGSDMLFVTAGMGGGTGTGAAPVIARAARENGILTVGVVTKPFNFEGAQRMRQAESGIAELQQYVDTLIVIPNQNLFRIANERTTFAEAFRMADEVLHSGVRGITDLMVMPGFMNLDFADVKTVMSEMGKAMMGTGEADGDNRALRAAEAAIANPLLDDISMKGAKGVLINITGGLDMTLFEMDQAANRIKEEVDPNAQIKVGSTLGENLDGRIRVSIIATGIDAALVEQQKQKEAEEAAAKAKGKPQQQPQTQRLATTQETARRQTSAQGQPNVMASSGLHTTAPKQSQQQTMTTRPMASTGYATSPASSQPQKAAQNPAQQQSVSTASVNLSSSYFTMPSIMTPPPAPQVRTTSLLPPDATPEEVIEEQPESWRQEEPVERALPQSQIRGEEEQAPVQQRSPYSQAESALQATQAAARRATPSAPQRTLSPASADEQDMRMTQLASAASATDSSSSHTSQRAQSLFRRITGFGMIRPSAAREEEMEEEMEETDTAQSRLSVDPSDRPALSSGNDANQDILDIPAFLRRQTNH